VPLRSEAAIWLVHGRTGFDELKECLSSWSALAERAAVLVYAPASTAARSRGIGPDVRPWRPQQERLHFMACQAGPALQRLVQGCCGLGSQLEVIVSVGLKGLAQPRLHCEEACTSAHAAMAMVRGGCDTRHST